MTLPTPEDLDEASLPALPARVVALLQAEHAPPRLWAHLAIVHGVAIRLIADVRRAWPKLAFDADAVAFGAATHDIGKARHPEELSVPGVQHEAAGLALLLEHGVAPTLARFAESHGQRAATLAIEDLLVITADTVWKAKRSKELDDLVVKAIAEATKRPAWDVFMRLDALLARIAADADERLEWQGRFSTTQ